MNREVMGPHLSVFNGHVNNAVDRTRRVMRLAMPEWFNTVEKIETDENGIMAIFHSKHHCDATVAFVAITCAFVNEGRVEEDIPYQITSDFETRHERLIGQIKDQRIWIADHGGDLAGYIERYGDPSREHCYGDGGTAIFKTDNDALTVLETRAKMEGVDLD